MTNLVEIARKVAELRARADSADDTLEREDAALRAAIIDSVRDVLPALVSPLDHLMGLNEARGIHAGSQGILVKRDRTPRQPLLVAFLSPSGELCPLGPEVPRALEVSEAISRAFDTQLAGLPKAEARQMERAETLRAITRMIRAVWGQR